MIYFGIDQFCKIQHVLNYIPFTTFAGWSKNYSQTKTVMLNHTTTWSFHRDSASILSTILLNQKHCSQNASSRHVPPTLLWISRYSQ